MRNIPSFSFLLSATLLTYAFGVNAAPVDHQVSRPPRPETHVLQFLKDSYKRSDEIPAPEGNPYTEAKAKLGKILFFDPRLSRTKVMSCATCHNPGFNWSDGNAIGVGDSHKPLTRKDPPLLNLAWDTLFFWDGRAESLEQQALMPIESKQEMNLPISEAVSRIKAIAEYEPLFAAAFPGEVAPITSENIAKAIATFERSIVSGESPFDHWINGDDKAISAEAVRGFELFSGKARCSSCHTGWRFTDGSFHDIGMNDADLGRGKWLPIPSMQHAFKTTGLRNIARRAPYMHNGSLSTLMDVINHYDHGFVKRQSLSDNITPLRLTDGEKDDLIVFLKTLTSEDKPITIPDMPQ